MVTMWSVVSLWALWLLQSSAWLNYGWLLVICKSLKQLNLNTRDTCEGCRAYFLNENKKASYDGRNQQNRGMCTAPTVLIMAKCQLTPPTIESP